MRCSKIDYQLELEASPDGLINCKCCGEGLLFNQTSSFCQVIKVFLSASGNQSSLIKTTYVQGQLDITDL